MSARQTHAPNAINRLYPLHNATYNETALVTAHTGPADTNDDGYADFTDFNVITSHFGHASGGGDAVGDLNHDGIVDQADEDIWLGHNGNSYGATPTWQVTERLAYNPYGAFTVSVQDDTGTWRSDLAEYLGWNITFQGGRWDSLTRQVQFGIRSVDVDTDRWTSQDRGYFDGLNLYVPFAANPINGRDPTGLKRILVIFEGAAVPIFGANTLRDALNANLHLIGSGSGAMGTGEVRYPRADLNNNEFTWIREGTGFITGLTASPTSDGVTDALIKIKGLLGNQNGNGCHNTIAVVGHSWGGDAAWEFLGRLSSGEVTGVPGVHANLVATFDARPRFGSGSGSHSASDTFANGYWASKDAQFSWANVMPTGWPGEWYNYFREPDVNVNGRQISAPYSTDTFTGFSLPSADGSSLHNTLYNGGHLDIAKNDINAFIYDFMLMRESRHANNM